MAIASETVAMLRINCEAVIWLVCVEGWSAIAWWGRLRFDDLLGAYPAMSQAKWARIESSVNLGPWGNPDPYLVSLDLSTARHPQTLLATHLNGKPLTGSTELRFDCLYL
jgi:DMSO/TMAO reductase YedYZ molybdopterin-dependent catalytic subunit